MDKLEKNQKIVVIVAGLIIAIVIGMYIFSQMRENNIEEEINFTSEEFIENKVIEEEAEIIVHITGAVEKEGIVSLKEGDRIADAIKEAGGIKDNADLSTINLAYILEDGQKIYIPTKEEMEEIKSNNELKNEESIQNGIVSGKEESSKVNINNADINELNTLPGIGSKTAEKIVEYRKEQGRFKGIEDIKNVKGIGEAKYNKIKEMIKI